MRPKVLLEFLPGTDIKEAAEYATRIVRQTGLPVSFSFNGEEIEVNALDTADRLVEIFHGKLYMKYGRQQPSH